MFIYGGIRNDGRQRVAQFLLETEQECDLCDMVGDSILLLPESPMDSISVCLACMRHMLSEWERADDEVAQ
jgi:hypothetical protein